MNNPSGVTKLPRLFEAVQWGRFSVKNRIKYGACCVSNYNTRDGFVTEREVARTRVIAVTGCGIITIQGAYPDPRGEGKAYFRQIALFETSSSRNRADRRGRDCDPADPSCRPLRRHRYRLLRPAVRRSADATAFSAAARTHSGADSPSHPRARRGGETRHVRQKLLGA